MAKQTSPVFAVIHREIQRIRQNPAYRFLLFFGPVIGFALLYFIFRQGVVKEIDVAVVDRDNSALAVKITNAINAAPETNVTLKTQNIFEAQKQLENGNIDGIILFPIEMEKNVLQGIESPVSVYINGTNVLKSGLLQRSLLSTLKTVSGGIQYKKLLIQGKTEREALSVIQPVQIQKHVLFNPYTNYFYFLNSAMLYVMLYLFVFLSSVYTLGNELKRGSGQTLLSTSGGSVRLAVLGKLFPYTIIFIGLAVFVNFLLFTIEGMPLNGSYFLIFAGQIATIITYQLMALIFVGITINLRLALSLGSAYSMMSITFSGLTFPIEGMPKIAQILATLFPFTWWEKIIISQALRGAPIKEALVYLCYILAFLLLSLCFLPVYKKYLSHEKYWGKA